MATGLVRACSFVSVNMSEVRGKLGFLTPAKLSRKKYKLVLSDSDEDSAVPSSSDDAGGKEEKREVIDERLSDTGGWSRLMSKWACVFPTFDGKPDGLESWLDAVNLFFIARQVPESVDSRMLVVILANGVAEKIKERARSILRRGELTSWEAVMEDFVDFFGHRNPQRVQRQKLAALRLRLGENPDAFLTEWRKIVRRLDMAYTDVSESFLEAVPSEYVELLCRERCSNVDELEMALWKIWEDYDAAVHVKRRVAAVCSHCGKKGHRDDQCFRKQKDARKDGTRARAVGESSEKRSSDGARPPRWVHSGEKAEEKQKSTYVPREEWNERKKRGVCPKCGSSAHELAG